MKYVTVSDLKDMISNEGNKHCGKDGLVSLTVNGEFLGHLTSVKLNEEIPCELGLCVAVECIV